MKTLVVVTAALALTGCSGRIVNQGEKVGTVIKLAQQGFFVKTWEGELIRGGMSNGSGGFSTKPLEFTINDEGLRRKVQDALDNQYEVRVTYNDYFCYTSIASENGCLFLSSIEKR